VSSSLPFMSSFKSLRGPATEQWQRVLSAVVILPPLLLFLTYASQRLFLLLICLLMWMSLREYFRLLAYKHASVRGASLVYTAALALALTAYLGGLQWMPLTLSLSIVVLTINVMVTETPTAHPFPVLLHSLFGMLLIGWGLSHLVLLRGLEFGERYILLLCVIIWAGDAMAMYVGRGLGRHKMAPSMSPGKTWEGAVGGVMGCLLAAVLGTHFLAPQLSLRQSLMFGLIVSCAAQTGDLGESMLKRYVGVKDSGTLIPGHGGILDRIDSLFLATPLAFYTLNFLMTQSAP
jgi:phosphatidate cytidylyltransferase